MNKTIKCKIDSSIAIITFSRPKVNAINAEFVSQLQAELDLLEKNDSIKGIIFTGMSGFFSAGLDVVELFPLGKKEIYEFWKKFNRLLLTIFSYPKLIFSAINGHSPAGGAVIAIMTDYRIMSSGKFKIGLNEVAVGLTLPGAIGEVLQYILVKRQAERCVLTGALFSAEEAFSLGMVDEVCDQKEV